MIYVLKNETTSKDSTHVKSCDSCQNSKKHRLKYRHILPKVSGFDLHSTVVPRLIGHPVNRTPRLSGHASSGTQPRESNGKKSKKKIKNEVLNVL